jgi:hypothetical protein
MNDRRYQNPFEADRLARAGSFVAEWDVPSLNERISTDLGAELDRLRERLTPDAREKVRLVIGPPGYGKTHLFGRLHHAQGGRFFFVYVPQILDTRRPAEHARWHIAEALFAAEPNTPSALQRTFCQLLAPSFASYFESLGAAYSARHAALRQQLKSDPLVILELLRPVKDMLPFHRLADSVASQFSHLPADILRAFVLGLSPAAHSARAWLRGDALTESKAAELQLKAAPAEAKNILHCLTALLQRVQLPVLLCFDQLEAVVKDPTGPRAITTEVMAWLDEIPNLLIVMSCLESEWDELRDRGFKSFEHRVALRGLEPLSPAQAVELVRLRLGSWVGYQPQHAATWPFDPAALEQFVTKTPPPARSFLKECAAKFAEWLNGPRDALIDATTGGKKKPTLEDAFSECWSAELSAVQQGGVSPHDQQEERLYRGVQEAVWLAYDGKLSIDGVCVVAVQEGALKASAGDGRPSLDLRLAVGNQAFHVIVAVTRNDSGVRFGAYLDALQGAIGKQVAGAVLVRPAAAIKLGKTSKAYKAYEKSVSDGKVRPFPLDAEPQTFAALECLVRLLQRAEAGDLELVGQRLTADQCRGLLVRLKLLDQLKLFNIVLAGWPPAAAARSAVRADQAANGVAASHTATPKAAASVAPTPAAAAVAPAGPRAVSGAPLPGGPAPASAGTAPTAPTWAENMLARLVTLLRDCRQPVAPQGTEIGPTFARLKVSPRGQTDVQKIRRKAENIQLGLGLTARPVVGTQAGYISIDIQRPERETVPLRDVLATESSALRGQVAFPVGKDVSGRTHWLNLGDTSSCHLLIAGTTGSGKSEFMKAMLAALASRLSPQELQLVLIDPKRVTFNLPGASPYLRAPIAHDVGEALPLIEDCFTEMEHRYALLEERRLENVSQLTGAAALPRIIVLFDEFADLMLDRDSKKDLERLVTRLGAKARAAGIHLILATQRTEASVVTPLLRTNLPARISLRVMGERDSNLILGVPDAAHLLGRGDLLWLHSSGMLRLQSPFVGRQELETALRVE